MESETLWMLLSGRSSMDVAESMDTRPEVIRNRMREVYRKFAILGSGPGKLPQLQSQLASMARSATPSPLETVLPPTPAVCTADLLDNVPPGPPLVGRDSECLFLGQTLQQEVGLCAILGPPGIGKTALASNWVTQVRGEFEQVIWISLDRVPQLTMAWHQATGQTVDRPDQIIQYLKQNKCLLILDHYESILQPNQAVGTYRPGYADYGTLIEGLGTQSQRGYALITSAEKPTEFVQLESNNGPVRSLPLQGLSDSAATIFWQTQGLSESTPDLTHLYQGNPGLMQLAANTIKELFNGQAAALLKAKTQVFDPIAHLLDKSWHRLTDLEREITYWFVLISGPCDDEDLEDCFWLPPNHSELFQALSFLRRRYLLESHGAAHLSQFALAAIVQQHITQQLANQLTTELLYCFTMLDLQQLDGTKIPWLMRLQLDRSGPLADHPLGDLMGRQVRRQMRSAPPLTKSLPNFADISQDHGFQSWGYLSNNWKQICQMFPEMS
jgi:hypothetical protein